MKSRRLAGACLMVLLGGCAPTDADEAVVEQVVEPPLPEHEILTWGAPARPAAGFYRGRGHYSQHGFLTMERTLFDSVEAHWEIALGDEHQARLCTQGVHRSGGSVSHYASHDGKDHHDEHEYPWFTCMSGTWQPSESETGPILLTLERVSHLDPAVEAGAFDAEPGVTALCWGLESVRGISGPGLACRFHGRLYQSEQVALAIEGTKRDGSWTQREDITLRGEPTFGEGASPWIVGAMGPENHGLVIRSSDDGRGRGGGDGVALSVDFGVVPALVPPAR